MQFYLTEAIQKALIASGIETGREIQIEKPTDRKFGDFSTNVALVLAKECRMNPRQLAEKISGNLVFRENTVRDTAIAGPGFINFYLEPAFIMQSAEQIIVEGGHFGSTCRGKGKKAIVEYVSANPTGPLTIGRGRGGVLGDCIANLLETQGYEVTREYYFNDAGRQMTILAESVRLRYRELCGRTVAFPETHYQGDYIRDIAARMHEKHGQTLADADGLDEFKQAAETVIFTHIKQTLHRLGIRHDSYFNEHKLYLEDDSGRSANDRVVEALKEKGFVSEYDGATWFTTTKLGQEKDKVLIKSSGEPSYRLPDIAYHVTKFERGFSEIVNVFGADHIDEYPDVVEALNILGYEGDRIRVAINQFVTTTVNGETVKMSTRKGNADLLDDLIDDVGADATRLFFIMRGKDSHLNFDVELAKKQSKDNPVFYLQYAHARICSLLRMAEKEIGFSSDGSGAHHMQLLDSEHELRLAFGLADYPLVIENCIRLLEPQKMVEYLHSVAELYHRFYQECPILKAEPDIRTARLFLSVATRQVLRNGFGILGVTAPESM
ncbi:arginine--tRNA ligase [Prosthecochloris sp. GSB1]|uniref:arginine--tRNA ligase n=1 Tax=Prosthecochloris sp. GSB1 TaxID=281093 RepID=UPI000B8D1197|nr:arginine--tRNA ligase [Prosthecochloris sp. GSB1]ASQ91463.1 arginine--tRNA ligase [Prosthecochloris sp. GSB1]